MIFTVLKIYDTIKLFLKFKIIINKMVKGETKQKQKHHTHKINAFYQAKAIKKIVLRV